VLRVANGCPVGLAGLNISIFSFPKLSIMFNRGSNNDRNSISLVGYRWNIFMDSYAPNLVVRAIYDYIQFIYDLHYVV